MHIRMRFAHLSSSAAAMLAVGAALVVLAGCVTAPPAAPASSVAQRQAIVDNPIRTDADRKLDAARHPVDFLAFTQVQPGMQVLDVSAGAGYTTQVLALAVGPAGKVWAQREQPGAALTKRLADQPQRNVEVLLRPFEDPYPASGPPLDLVTLVLNYHDITFLPVDRAKMNARIFAALKAGGRFVVIDHSAKAGADISSGKTLHRIDQAIVVSEVTKAGFVVEAEGDFLRDPADTREASSGDAKIPTDKFALRFVKPR